jgi:FAD dependent oxidoreductase
METRADVVIAGGGTGGCAAAWAAARSGLRVILTEETDWIGGQFTSQGVPPDEHGWIEQFGCTRTYRQFRNAIREHYRKHTRLTEAARRNPRLNPGNGWVSPLCHEPRVSHQVLRELLGQFENLQVLTETTPLTADVDGDRVRAVTFDSQGQRLTITADWFVDATELGDLLPMTGCEHVSGDETGAPSNCQAFSWCFAMEHHEGADHRIARPERYSFWRDYVPRLSPPWPGPLFSWSTPNPRTMEPNHYRFEPHREAPKAFSGLWSYRRLIDRTLFEPGSYASDICLVNWPLIDYLEGDLCTALPEARARCLAEAREMSLAMFYWLQNDAPRLDGGCGWPGLRLAGEALGTADGFAKAAYIRESRRIRAFRTIHERDLSQPFDDSVGIGYYRIDLHPSTGGDNYIDVPAPPFRIPLGALIPVRMRNLLPACKNIGTTHITNGCYRLHPVEWNIGEAVGLLAAYCRTKRTQPHTVVENYEDFQTLLDREGIERAWPDGLDLDAGDAHIHAR